LPAVLVLRMCKLCGGTGKTDWVSNLNKEPNKPIDNTIRQKIFRNNIERLVYQLKEECYQATGMTASIDIKMENNFDRAHLMYGIDYGKTIPKNKTI
jgi:hypothetical protein